MLVLRTSHDKEQPLVAATSSSIEIKSVSTRLSVETVLVYDHHNHRRHTIQNLSRIARTLQHRGELRWLGAQTTFVYEITNTADT